MKFDCAIDLGASQTKCFYRWSAGEDDGEGWMIQPSAIAIITSSYYANSAHLADDNTALIAEGGNYWIVGEQAKDSVSTTDERIQKSHHAIARALAVVGQCLKRHGLDEEVRVRLSLLLPLDEKAQFSQVTDRLVSGLCEFGLNGDKVTVFPEKVIVYPEGSGVARYAKRSPASVLVFGHKDMSVIHVQNGSLSLAKSRTYTGWGIVKLLKFLSVGVRDDLIAAQAVMLQQQGKNGLAKIVPASSLDKAIAELQEARELVWAQYRDRFEQDKLLGLAEQVICTGGNAPFWVNELKEKFETKTNLATAIIRDMRDRFLELRGKSLQYRGTDVYALWLSDFEIPLMSKKLAKAK